MHNLPCFLFILLLNYAVQIVCTSIYYRHNLDEQITSGTTQSI